MDSFWWKGMRDHFHDHTAFLILKIRILHTCFHGEKGLLEFCLCLPLKRVPIISVGGLLAWIGPVGHQSYIAPTSSTSSKQLSKWDVPISTLSIFKTTTPLVSVIFGSAQFHSNYNMSKLLKTNFFELLPKIAPFHEKKHFYLNRTWEKLSLS